MLTIAKTLEETLTAHGEFRAGGTDVQERRRSGVSRGDLIDLNHLTGLDRLEWDTGGAARIGARVPIATVAADERMRRSYPGFAQAAGGLATPQIRAMGTLGGSLLQRTRCWYYRQPEVDCYKKDGDACPARAGNHLYGVVFDLGPCAFPHPSTLGMALLAYEAGVEIQGRGLRPIAEVYGDGADPYHDHQLKAGELLTHVLMPKPLDGERAAYFRAISRARAEWPLVEAVVRLGMSNGRIEFARVAAGGVANIPLRLTQVESALTGQPATPETLARAAALAAEGARPLPMTAYKVPLLRDTVLETLERALDLSR